MNFKKRLLVLDDDPDIQDFIAVIAAKVGVDAVTATDPQRVIDQFSTFDIFMIDLMMPRCDGIEVLRLVAQINPAASVILMSGKQRNSLEGARAVAMERGLNVIGVLSKPFKSTDVAELLSNSLLPKVDSELSRESTLATLEEFREGIIKDEFFMVYQPKLQIQTGKFLGVEALVRWNHPVQNLLHPCDFIHMAEMSRFSLPFAFEVINLVCEDIRDMRKQLGLQIPVSVNLPLYKLHDLLFPEKALAVLSRMDMDPSKFCFELTETSIVKSPEVTLDILTRLHMREVTFSIDDFGIQHSNLDRLKTYPFSELKIDKAFVTDLPTNEKSYAITKTAIRLGQSLGMRIVAEGVEDHETLDVLSKLGCDAAQGYLISKPLTTESLVKWLCSPDNFRCDNYAINRSSKDNDPDHTCDYVAQSFN